LNIEERSEIEEQLLLSTRGTLDLLNNVLSWSKNQMDGIKFTRTVVNVSALLSSHLLIFQPIAQRKKITFQMALDPLSEIIANGDMVQLIIRNLVNNAVKFTAAGGTINVTTASKNGMCRIAVSDSGNGQPVQLSDNIFNLNSGSVPGTGNEKGAGLGLVLCKQFTEALEGKIWFECNVKSGATFSVEFPLYQRQTIKTGTTETLTAI